MSNLTLLHLCYMITELILIESKVIFLKTRRNELLHTHIKLVMKNLREIPWRQN